MLHKWPPIPRQKGMKAVKATLLFVGKRLHLPLLPFLLVAVLECLSRVSFRKFYDWFLDYPDEFWFNYWIALFITLLVAGAIGRTRPAYALLLAGFGITGWVSGMKWNETGTPLYLWDLLLPGSGEDPVTPLNPKITMELLYIGAAALGASAVVVVFRGLRLMRPERAVYGAVSLFLLCSVWQNYPVCFWDFYRITTFRYEQERSFARNGFLAASFDSIDLVRPEKPKGTGPSDIRKLVRSLMKNSEEAIGASGAADDGGTRVKPNVIVLLSETFWDPTLLPRATFTEDPIPFFRSLMQSTTGGWMLTPQFSGTTANVEFEVLTGNSIRFLPSGSIPYINYMNRGVDSLAAIFARDGYTSTAINPFFNWFFNSRNAYRNMGFSRFISCEYFEPRFHGPNYEDLQVMEKIIETTESSPGPDFVFANTMENHGGYEDKFYYNPIKVTGTLSAKAINMLENYATGEQAFDKAFRSLIEHYSKSKEPTVVLCFGDHLPGLGSGYLAYKEAGYITGADDADFMEKMHYTPFVIWDNIGSRPKESLRMNAGFLGPYLLQYVEQPGTYYTDFLYELYRKQPVIPIRPYRKQHPMDESVLADYKRLQYDILFGPQTGYREAGLRDRIVPPEYTLGYGKPKLEKAVLQEDGRLEVYGANLSSECTVWLNGAELTTSSREGDKLTARLPDGMERPAFPWHLQVRLVDLKHTELAESGELALDYSPAATAEAQAAPEAAPEEASALTP